MWMVGFVTFFLSAILDNLTTTIVMVSLMKKLLGQARRPAVFCRHHRHCRQCGGAWTPIGDVTTTMLWIGGQITPWNIMKGCFCHPWSACWCRWPSRAHAGWTAGGTAPPRNEQMDLPHQPLREQPDVLPGAGHSGDGSGVQDRDPPAPLHGHPVWSGDLVGWWATWCTQARGDLRKQHLTLVRALTRIDMSSIVFFIGILLAVAVLEHTHILKSLAQWLDKTVGRQDVIVILIGLVSAMVDNVPLVAASMGMYSLTAVPARQLSVGVHGLLRGHRWLHSDHWLGSWRGRHGAGENRLHLVCEEDQLLALVGYFAGAMVYILQYPVWMVFGACQGEPQHTQQACRY
jgi:hypothetical protein